MEHAARNENRAEKQAGMHLLQGSVEFLLHSRHEQLARCFPPQILFDARLHKENQSAKVQCNNARLGAPAPPASFQFALSCCIGSECPYETAYN